MCRIQRKNERKEKELSWRERTKERKDRIKEIDNGQSRPLRANTIGKGKWYTSILPRFRYGINIRVDWSQTSRMKTSMGDWKFWIQMKCKPLQFRTEEIKTSLWYERKRSIGKMIDLRLKSLSPTATEPRLPITGWRRDVCMVFSKLLARYLVQHAFYNIRLKSLSV